MNTPRPGSWHPQGAADDDVARVGCGRDGAMVAPRQERSLQLFGDEKRLDTSIVGSALWCDRLLNDRLLATVEVTTPMPVWPTGDGPALLVVENKATFWSAAQGVLAGRGTPVGAVGWPDVHTVQRGR